MLPPRLVLTVICLAACLAVRAHAASSSEVKLFSGPVVSVWDLFPDTESGFWKKGSMVESVSPDRQEKLEFPSGWGQNDTNEYTLFAVVKKHKYAIRIDGYMQPHVIWAKDSSGSLIFYGDAGVNCCYETK